MTAKEFLALWLENDQETPEGWEEVESGDWIADYKYQNQESVYFKDGQYFCVVQTRSGSPFSDYNYEDPECFEVVPEVVETVTYKVKK